MKKNKNQKVIAILLIIANIFLNVGTAQAISVGSVSGLLGVSSPEQLARRMAEPMAKKSLDYILKTFKLSTAGIQKMAEFMNVSSFKRDEPQVSITFSPSNPKPGETVTAMANPTYFSNTNEQLFFTWYLKHKEDDTGKTKLECQNKEPQKNCNWDGQNGIDIEDYKIEAARINAQGGWEPNWKDLAEKIGMDPAVLNKKTQEEKMALFYDNTKDIDDDDYFVAKDKFGGDLSTNKFCFINDFDKGIQYQIVKSTSTTSDNSSGESSTQVDPVCIDEDGSETDPICVSDIDPVPSPCDVTDTENSTYTFCSEASATPTCDSKGRVVCGSNKHPSDGVYSSSPACLSSSDTANNLTSTGICGADITYETNSAKSCSRMDLVLQGTSKLICKNSGSLGEAKSKGGCKHLFPKPNTTIGNTDFSLGEEEFWGTDPRDPSTAKNGNTDMKNIIGLGVTQFSWIYQAGDKIGVAIEGISMKPTKFKDSSMMAMWALPLNECDVTNKGSYTYTDKEFQPYGAEIPTSEADINSCLEDNFVDPVEGGQATNLKPTLSFSPENPLQDPEGIETDIINVQANFDNAEASLPNIYYEWTIQRSTTQANFSDYCDQDEWKATKCDQKFTEINRLSGNNLSSLNFKPNLDESDFGSTNPDGSGIVYFKVHLDAYENFSPGENGTTRVGRADVIIKLIRPVVKLEAFIPSVGDSDYKLGWSAANTKMCDQGSYDDNGLQKYICYVTPNQIVGAVVVDSDGPSADFKYSWMLDGKPLNFDNDFCSDADCQEERVTYFPVNSNAGTNHNLIVNLTSERTGKTIQLGKIFEVVDPYVKIVNDYDSSIETESSWPKYLGKYEDVNGVCEKITDSTEKEKCLEKFYDFSDYLFETNNGNSVKLKAEYHPGWIQGDIDNYYSKNKSWVLDGYEQGDNLSNELTFSADKDVNDAYNVEFQAIYNQSQKMRRALNKIWGISSFSTAESNLSSMVQIEVVESETVAKKNEEKAILASILGNTSENIIFFLRLALTAALVIFISGLIFSIAPKRKTYLG